MEEMKEQRISNKIYGPSTTAGKLDIRETDAQNCMARPPKLVSLLMWPIHQRTCSLRLQKCTYVKMKSSQITGCSSSLGYTDHTVFIYCYLGTVK